MINIKLELWERKRDETCRDLQFHLCCWQGGEVYQASSDVLAQLHCPMARSGPNPAHVYLNQIPFKSKLLWWIILKNRSKNPYQSDFDLNEIWLRYMHTGSGSHPALGQCRLSLAWKPLAGLEFIRPQLAKTEAWAELVGLGWLRLGFSPSHSFMQLHIVLPKFGSEPKFEPEPLGPNSKFSSRFRIFAELNLRSSSKFSKS